MAYGGPDVGLLCATGKVRKVVCGFVTLDSIALDPHFRAARQAGQVEAMEVDEGMFFLGLLAASWRVPFLPTRAGLGSDVLTVNPDLRLVRSPYGVAPHLADPADAEVELVAMPALRLDAAIVHVNRADAAGNGQILSPDPFFDELFLGAAERRFVTTERIVVQRRRWPTRPIRCQTVRIHRMLTDGVAETPGGAHFTANPPDYGRDEAFQKEYAAAAGGPGRVGGLRRPLRLRATRTSTRPGSKERVGPDERRPPPSETGVTRAEFCVDRLRRRMARRRRSHGEPLRDRPLPRRPPGQAAPSRPTSSSPTARPLSWSARRLDRDSPGRARTGGARCRTAACSTWSGRAGATS